MQTHTIKRIASALLVTLALSLFAACSSDNNSPPLATPTTPTTPTTPPLAQPTTFTGLSAGQSLQTNAEVVTFQSTQPASGNLQTDNSGNLAGAASGYVLTTPSGFGSSAYAIQSTSGGFNGSDAASGTSISGTFASDVGLTYSAYGIWGTTSNSASSNLRSAGVFATGIGTSTNSRPASGSATYSGKTTGFVSMNTGEKLSLKGDVSLNANFGANSISGAITGLSATQLTAGTLNTNGAAMATNSISLRNGTISGNAFAGQAVAVDGPHTFPIGGSAGQFSGNFFGPAAAEAAGTVSMTQPGMNIVTSFGAKK